MYRNWELELYTDPLVNVNSVGCVTVHIVLYYCMCIACRGEHHMSDLVTVLISALVLWILDHRNVRDSVIKS